METHGRAEGRKCPAMRGAFLFAGTRTLCRRGAASKGIPRRAEESYKVTRLLQPAPQRASAKSHAVPHAVRRAWRYSRTHKG